jgi:hypothetical protein
MKKFIPVLIASLAVYIFSLQNNNFSSNDISIASSPGDQILEEAFEHQSSDIQIEGEGTVVKILPDDNDGDRHQRFIIQLNSGQTLLIAHNIDLAPRVPGLSQGDQITFSGEYEWNSKGGVIHWTHHDPDGRHPAGWIKHSGKTYQ